jgi:hypothetical protein
VIVVQSTMCFAMIDSTFLFIKIFVFQILVCVFIQKYYTII